MRRILLLFAIGASLVTLILGGFAIHLWTTYLSYRSYGFIATIATFAFPPISEIVWFILLWREVGIANWYSLSLALYCVAAGGMLFADRMEMGMREKPPRSVAEELRAIRPK